MLIITFELIKWTNMVLTLTIQPNRIESNETRFLLRWIDASKSNLSNRICQQTNVKYYVSNLVLVLFSIELILQ